SIELNADELDVSGPGGGTAAQIALMASGVCNIAGSIFAVDGTPALPSLITTDSWHNFSLTGGTSAGTDINGTTYNPAYMLTPTGDVKLKGVVKAAAGGLAVGTTWAVIPAAYRPATNIPTLLVANGTLGTFAHVYIRPNGNVQFDKALGGGVSMYLDGALNLQGV
ncbi:MAG: hypothetical protein ACREBW_03200, partial [Candidatus Micrarchaeaceae archaeon]